MGLACLSNSDEQNTKSQKATWPQTQKIINILLDIIGNYLFVASWWSSKIKLILCVWSTGYRLMASLLPQSCQLLSWLSIVIIIKKVHRSYKPFILDFQNSRKLKTHHNFSTIIKIQLEHLDSHSVGSMISFSKSWSCETKMCEWMLRKHSFDPDFGL